VFFLLKTPASLTIRVIFMTDLGGLPESVISCEQTLKNAQKKHGCEKITLLNLSKKKPSAA
jgi:hypothetical protein